MRLPRLAMIAAAAGGLAALGHAPFGLLPVSLVGFAALVWAVSRSDGARRVSAMVAWIAGTAYFAVALHWIVEPFLVDVARHGWMAPFALILLAAGLALFWGVAGWIAGAGGASRRALTFAVAMALAEFARGTVLSGFPWALPAYVWIDWPVRYLASWIGPYGLTAVTLVALALPAIDGKVWRGALASTVVLGILSLAPAPGRPDETLGVVRLVQPNAPQNEKWDPEKAHTFVERQIEFTAAPKNDVDFIVWPETAVPYRLETATPVLQRIAGGAEGVPISLGINRREEGRNYNALISLGPNGAPTDIYDKVRLVPFGEFIPLGQLAEVIGIRSFAAQDGYGFSSGGTVRVIETPLGQALPLICYEAIFPQHIRSLEERPDFLLQITNDAWFGTFSGPYQHLDQARFRALEQGLALVRVANTGVSAVIGPGGDIIDQIALGEAGYKDVVVPVPLPATFYSSIGDIPVFLLLCFAFGGLEASRRRNAIAKSAATG